MVRNGKVEYRIVEAWSEQEMQPLTREATGLMNAMKVCGGTAGGIVPAPFVRLESDPFAGLRANDLPVRKALIFVKGVERSTMDILGAQRKMSTKVQCVYHEEAKDACGQVFRLIAFCHEQADRSSSSTRDTHWRWRRLPPGPAKLFFRHR